MRILYGVVGEGMGHAMRSRVVLDELTRHHEVQVVVSGRAYDYLKARESDRLGVNRIWGLSIVYEDNRVKNFRTVLENLRGALVRGGWPENIRAWFDLTERFRPEVVISDFESWSYLYAKVRGLPVVSVDNQQIIARCRLAPEAVRGHMRSFRLTRALVAAKLPRCFHYLVTTFFFPPVAKPRTTLVPPILRRQVLDAVPEPGGHLLVYQTSTSYGGLLEELRRCGVECRVYGVRRDLREEVREGNLRFRPFSEAGFVDDLRTARGVVSNGGFTLLGEAVYLGRPVLSVPVAKQFEQVLNARYLEREGYGLAAGEVDAATLGEFLDRTPEFRRNLERYRQDGNRVLFERLEDVLGQAVRMGVPPGAVRRTPA
ncbi:MAG TPA: MJ1255/VC2487 family glycosyltransferase [Anaeromyxobacteraceae bacterium]|nr:MJ1255/VC2487 family glycosyltransferase [Anaeromyxobacteraceae bacterium]